MSSSNKLVRELKRQLKVAGFDVLGVDRPPHHIKITIRHKDGRQQVLVTAGSPTNADHTVRNVVQDAKRFASGYYSHG